MHVKRGDTVKLSPAKIKGKEGKIITAIPADGKVIVEGVAVAKRHQRQEFKVRKAVLSIGNANRRIKRNESLLKVR